MHIKSFVQRVEAEACFAGHGGQVRSLAFFLTVETTQNTPSILLIKVRVMHNSEL